MGVAGGRSCSTPLNERLLATKRETAASLYLRLRPDVSRSFFLALQTGYTRKIFSNLPECVVAILPGWEAVSSR